MAYTENKKADGLDELTSLDTGDLVIVADASDSFRAKKITKANSFDTKINTSDIDTTVTLGTSDTKVPSQKAVKTYVDNKPSVTIETTTGTTHSLTTTAGQKVIVWAKGNGTKAAVGTSTFTLKYNGTTKDTVRSQTQANAQDYNPFALMYTETPGAATANITVETDASMENVVIIVMKIG